MLFVFIDRLEFLQSILSDYVCEYFVILLLSALIQNEFMSRIKMCRHPVGVSGEE